MMGGRFEQVSFSLDAMASEQLNEGIFVTYRYLGANVLDGSRSYELHLETEDGGVAAEILVAQHPADTALEDGAVVDPQGARKGGITIRVFFSAATPEAVPADRLTLERIFGTHWAGVTPTLRHGRAFFPQNHEEPEGSEDFVEMWFYLDDIYYWDESRAESFLDAVAGTMEDLAEAFHSGSGVWD